LWVILRGVHAQKLMNPKLLVSIDTEEDWQGPGETPEPTVRNICAIQDLQGNIFDEFHIKPVYLVSYIVVIDSKSVAILKNIQDSGRCEIGAHLHHWNLPPFTKKDVFEKASQCRLPYHVERSKIEKLTNVIHRAFGKRPVTFRAGRWAADGDTIKILAELGYKVDLSVTPLTDHTDEGGPNFYNAPFEPYFPSYRDIKIPCSGNDNVIMEIPVTCGFTRGDLDRQKHLYGKLIGAPRALHLVGIFSRLNLVNKIKLALENANFNEMRQLVDNCLKMGHKILHLTFHSSVYSVGTSPYSMTRKDRDIRVSDLRRILEYMTVTKKLKSCTAEEICAGEHSLF
jgi:hypothetical protein